MTEVLVQEIQVFKAAIGLSMGRTTYAADETWRENPYDDTVLAVAMAAWYGDEGDLDDLRFRRLGWSAGCATGLNYEERIAHLREIASADGGQPGVARHERA